MVIGSLSIGAKTQYLLAFLFSVLYVPYISGAATSPRWVFASIVLPLCLIYFVVLHKTLKLSLVHLIGLLFLTYGLVSLSWTYNDQGLYDLVKLLIITEAFLLGVYLTSLEYVFKGLALGIGISSILVLFGVSGGLFINVNTLAEISVMVLIGIFVYELWWYIPGLLPSIVVNGSRGAMLTLTAMFSLWLWNKSKMIAVSFLMLISSLIIIVINYRYETVYDRIEIWNAILDNVTIFGYGLGSFSLYGLYNIYSRPMFAHNDLLQILFELGIMGVILAVCFFTLVLRSKQKEKYIVIAFIIISCFDFPLHLPVSACIALLVCGYIAVNRDSVFICVNTS